MHIVKENFYYPSSDSITKIHGISWQGDAEVKAILQICHGMTEYIDRYDEFARFLAERGYYVVGHDHLGHGESVVDKNGYGYFHKSRGNEFVVKDIHKIRLITKKRYPDVPYFMLGHSMGSFLLRQYIQIYGRGLSGAVIMGTGNKPNWLLTAARGICCVLAKQKGWHYRSKLLNQMAFASYNKKFEPARTVSDWLTKDEAIVDAYLKDPRCTFVFTVNGFYHMFGGMKELTKEEKLNRIPKNLPLFFVAGEEDPVGDYGKGITHVYNQYQKLGIKDIEIKLYKDDRHEILNETDRQQVYEDLFQWLEIRKP